MPYFFINLTMHLLVSFGILSIVLYCKDKNDRRKNHRGVYFLLPTLFTILFLFQVISFSIPRVLDIVHVLKNNYRSEQGIVESVGYLNNTVVIDESVYYFNPFLYKPEKGDELFITYTPNAKYVNEFRRIENDEQQRAD